MFTDIVGYTSLTQSNESMALGLLEKHRGLIRPLFAKHRGREVKTIGDAFLVEFASALEATECAIEIQKILREYNQNAAEKVLIRIGIHVGDVIEKRGDVYGDAVNIASRIEPFAKGGEVCISEQVHDQVRNKVGLVFIKLETVTLKNVNQPIDLYRLVMPWEGTPSEEAGGLDKHRIAVLPLKNMSPDPNDEFFAEGMTEELITTLSKVGQLTVLARTSVMQYKNTIKRISSIARELNTGTLIEGSVRKASNKVRITVQLLDGATEGHVWAENYDRQLDDIFSIQSEIAKSVSEALKVQLFSGEEKRLDRKATESSSAYVRYLSGRAALHNRNRQDLLNAKRFFEDAISEDGGFAMAYVGLADAYFLLGEYFFMPMAEALQKSNEALTKALSIDENLAEGRTALANSLQHDYKFAEAIR